MEALIKDLESPEEADRIYAAQDLQETLNPAAAGPLAARLEKEASQAVRDAIIFALKSLPCEKIYPQLLDLFRSPDPYLRNGAIQIFGSEGKKAVSFLSACSGNEDREVRKLILDALFATAAPEALAPIREHLCDRAVNVRITAVEYLGRLDDRNSLDQIIEMLKRETEPMLKIALLETILQTAHRKKDLQNVLAILEEESQGQSPINRLYIPQVLGLAAMTGDPETIAAVISALWADASGEIYAEEILRALESAKERFPKLMAEDAIQGMLSQIPDPRTRDRCTRLLST